VELGYRAILRLDDGESAIEVAESQLSAWLRSKGRSGIDTFDWDGAGIYRVGPSATLTVVHADDYRDESRRRLYRLQERNSGSTWEVSLRAFDTPRSRSHAQSLTIDVSTDLADEPRVAVAKVAPPKLARMILESHSARDGAASLSGRPLMVRGDEAQEVLAAIKDTDRTAAVVVAPAPWGREHEAEWQQVVTSLTRESVGVAATYILDEDATGIVAAGLPASHTVANGVVRTFGPHVDTDAPDDRLRHLMLFPDTLARSLSPSRKVAAPLAKRHAESTRLRMVTRELPPDLRRGIDVLRRAEADQQRSQTVASRVSAYESELRASPAPNSGQSGLMSYIGTLVKRWLKADRVDEKSILDLGAKLEAQAVEIKLLNEQFDSLADENGRVRDELDSTRDQFDELHLAVTIAEDAVRDNEREMSVLRNKLVSAGASEDAYVEPLADIWDAPDDMYELLARITPGTKTHPVFDQVVFTGDQDAAFEIEKRGQGMRYAHAFWDYIHVLYDYAGGKERGDVTCGVHQYLKSDQLDGHKCSPERHAPTESDTTLKRWGKERTFPVPKVVNHDEEIRMAAHFKPTWTDTFAPRMHYFDDTDGTGKIYVGYIGRHLTNTKS